MTSDSNKNPILRKAFRICTVGLIAVAWLQPVIGQDRPFDSIHFGVVGGMDFVETQIHETWKIPAVAGVYVASPFYAGQAVISATYLPASSRSTDVTDFWAIYAGAGLNYPLKVGPRVEVLPGFRFGSMYMNFSDEPVDFRKEESEIFIAAELGVAASLSSSTRITFSSTLLHTFTEIPIDVQLFNVGVEYRIKTPGWLRKVLQ